MIDRNHSLSIVKQADAVGISRASVYYVPRPISVAELALMRRIDEPHLQHPFMGARQLKRELAKAGIDLGRCHIGSLMLRLDINAQCPQLGTSKVALGVCAAEGGWCRRTKRIKRSLVMSTSYLPYEHSI